MAEKIKQTRLEELDLRAKSLLEAWNKDTFGQQQQTAAGVNDSTLPFKRFAADHHKRQTETQIQASAIEAYKDGGYDAFFKEANESSRTDPPTLEERWDKSAFKGGPANEAKGGGSSTTNVSAKLSSPRPYEGEQNGQLSIKFLDQDFFVPDSPFNRDIWEKFKVTYASGKKDDEGKGVYDYFFLLADEVGAPAFGNATIRAHWEKFFSDGNAPNIQSTKIIRRNQWSQQDLNVQYDEGRDYRWTDSYYRYDVTTPDLEFGNADDPIAKVNHTSFTLRRTDANTIELKKNIQRATVQNETGVQWPNKTEHGASIFTRSGGGYSTGDSYYRYTGGYRDQEFGNADDPSTEYNHKSRILKNADTDELKMRIFHSTRANPRGQQWPYSEGNGAATFNRKRPYDERMQTSDVRTEYGYVVKGSTKILPTMLAWPQVSSIPPNRTPFSQSRPAKNLEELWFSLVNMKTAGPRSDQVQRPGNDSRISTIFSSSNISAADYKVRFLGALNGSFANVPGTDAVESQGRKGFNVGQVAPYDDDGNYVFGDKREMDATGSNVLKRILSKINSYEQQLMKIKPGGNRINIVFNIRLNLDRLLQQNLLMPTDLYPARTTQYGQKDDALDLATAIEEGTSSSLDDDTFTKLYLENRSALHASGGGFARTPPGTIAGVPVASLQGPVSYQNGHVANGKSITSDEDDGSPVFKFREEDGPQGRNNTITQDRGFIDNISGQVHGNRSGIGGLMPAVENDPAGAFQDETTFLKTRGRANEQFFPFMFETVNKKGSSIGGGPEYKQYAYFQATLQSLNESYAPAWSSKHFFGRTEQIHTYTMTDRTMDFSFVVFATEIRRLQNLYERVSWLAQQTYPSYDSSSRLKSGPLIRMTIGDMFSNLTGFIRSLSFDWNYLGPGGKWEITQGLRIPMACTVSINFTVMHDDMPDRNYAFYPGMLEGGKGLIGDRGKTDLLPNGGPLIATAERVARAKKGRQGVYSDLSHRERYELSSMGYEERKAYVYRKEAEAAVARGRGQQYIDSLYNNRSTGDRKKVLISEAGQREVYDYDLVY